MENQQTSFFKLVLKSLANLQEEKEKLAQEKVALEKNLKKVLIYLDSLKKIQTKTSFQK